MFLGMCITEWSNVEIHLFDICKAILKTTQEHTAIIYYRTPTLDSRLELTTEIVGTVLQLKADNGQHVHDDASQWNKLSQRIKDVFPIRNQLAHSPVGPTLVDENGNFLRAVTDGERYRFISYPSHQEKARPKTNKKPLKLSDLKNHLATTANLHTDVGMFLHATLPKHIPKP
jgi:hypothetical protein